MQVHKCTKSIKKKRKEKQLVYTGAVLWLEWRIKQASREWFVLWAKWRSPRTAHVSSRSGSGSRQEGMRTTQPGGTPQLVDRSQRKRRRSAAKESPAPCSMLSGSGQAAERARCSPGGPGTDNCPHAHPPRSTTSSRPFVHIPIAAWRCR